MWSLASTLMHLFPMHPFSTPWKYQKNLRFPDVFRGQRKGALGTNMLIIFVTHVVSKICYCLMSSRRRNSIVLFLLNTNIICVRNIVKYHISLKFETYCKNFKFQIWDHSISNFAEFFAKLIIFTPWFAYVHVLLYNRGHKIMKCLCLYFRFDLLLVKR